MLRSALIAFVLSTSVAQAWAADVAVSVRTPAGLPVADAVVTLYPATGVPKGAVRFPWAYRVEQRDMQFQPFVLVVPDGAEVSFPNRDSVLHHVYSFSPAKRFQLKLYGKGDDRTVTFENAGAVALGCNIHDSMVAFIKVVDTPLAAKTNAQGQAVIRGAPQGAAKIRIWHPYAKDSGEMVRPLTVSASGTRDAVVLNLRPQPRATSGY